MTRSGQDVVVLDVALVELARGRDKAGTIYNYCHLFSFENVDVTVIHRRGHRWQLWCAGLLHGGQPEASGHLLTRLLRPRP